MIIKSILIFILSLDTFMIISLTAAIGHLGENLENLKRWIEILHGIDFDKMSEAIYKWKEEEKNNGSVSG